jgi:hypothetical protein
MQPDTAVVVFTVVVALRSDAPAQGTAPTTGVAPAQGTAPTSNILTSIYMSDIVTP